MCPASSKSTDSCASRSDHPLVVFLVGPTCCGKTDVAEKLVSCFGGSGIEASDFVKESIPERPRVLDRLRDIDRLFLENGEDFVARRLHDETRRRIVREGHKLVVVSGCRKRIERDVIAHEFNSLCIAIHAESSLRFRWSASRARVDSPPDYETFLRASAWEFSIGLGRLLFECDHILVNDGTIEELRERVRALVSAHTETRGSYHEP